MVPLSEQVKPFFFFLLLLNLLSLQECKEVEKGGTFFDFQFNTRLVKSTIVHFQVEILLSVTLSILAFFL